MADNTRNIIGIAMDLDVTDLKAGLQETKKQINTANKQFAAATSGMDNWAESSEGLNAKLTQLDTVLKNQKRNVAGIEAELKQAKKQYGENSEQVRKLSDQLLDAQAAIGKTERAQRKYTIALQNVEKAEREAADESEKLATALKETDSATQTLKGGFTVLKGVIAGLVTSGITALVGGLKNAVEESREFRRELAYLEQTADTTGVSFDHAKEKLKEVTAITEDQGAAVEGLNNLMTAGFDGDALDKITDQLVGASIQWKDTLKFEGLSDGLQETLATGKAIGPFVELLERGGIVAEDFDAGMAALSTTAERQQYVMDTLSSLGLEGVTEGYREANKSLIEGAEANFDYSDSMAQIGEKIEPVFTTIKQGWVDVLNAFIDSSEGMDLETLKTEIKGAFQYFIDEIIPKIKEFVQFVLDNKDTIIAAIITIGGAFAGWKIASIVTTAITALQGMKTALIAVATGQRALNMAMMANPIGLIVGLIAGLVAAFITLWNTSDEFRNFWIGLWDNIKAAVQPVIDALAPLFSAAWENIKIIWDGVVGYFQTIFENIQTIFSVVGDILSGDFQGAFDGIKAIWDNSTGYFAGIFDGIKNIFANTDKALGNPFSNAWETIKDVWDGVGNWFGDVFNDIKKVFASTKKAVAQPFSNAWEAIKVVWNFAKGYFSLIWTNIKDIFSVVKAVLTGDFKGAWEGIKKIWNDSTAYFSNIINTIFNYFAELPSKLISIGSDMIDGLVQGVKSAAGRLAAAAADAVRSAMDAAKSFLGINSPSTVMRDEVGIPMGQGIGVGLLASAKDVYKDIKKFNSEIQGKIGQIQSGLTLPSSSPAYSNGVMGGNSVTNNNNYTQIINAPKQPSRIELYRQTKNLLALRGGYNNV